MSGTQESTLSEDERWRVTSRFIVIAALSALGEADAPMARSSRPIVRACCRSAIHKYRSDGTLPLESGCSGCRDLTFFILGAHAQKDIRREQHRGRRGPQTPIAKLALQVYGELVHELGSGRRARDVHDFVRDMNKALSRACFRARVLDTAPRGWTVEDREDGGLRLVEPEQTRHREVPVERLDDALERQRQRMRQDLSLAFAMVPPKPKQASPEAETATASRLRRPSQ